MDIMLATLLYVETFSLLCFQINVISAAVHAYL